MLVIRQTILIPDIEVILIQWN